MDPLLAYIPMDRCQAMAAGRPLPDRGEGAVLFADISGFTVLTEALAAELGPQAGPEELTRQLNRVYGALIAEVDAYRGSVIGFAGDAITCWFDGDDGRRGLACAMAMQAATSQFAELRTPAGVRIPVAIKIALVTGPVRRFLAGDPAIGLVDVLAGKTLDRMAAAEHLANRGEVIVSDEICSRFTGQLHLLERRQDTGSGEWFHVATADPDLAPRSPWPELPAGGIPVEAARPWLLPAVYQRLSRGQGEFLAELRPAVALFLKFTGIDYDRDPESGQKLDAYLRWVQLIVQRYEGALIQLTIGDKGSYLYVAFGAPQAHDDDPARAAAAALDLQALPAELSYIRGVQIGVCRGQMRAGAYGGPTRRTYGVLGDRTNLAARLMGIAAPGETLCDHETYRAAANVLDFETLPPVRVKGKAELVRVYRPTGERVGSQVGRSPAGGAGCALIGRQAESQRLEAALEQVAAGGSRVLVLEGEAGVGKSRLVAALKCRAQEHGLAWLMGAARSIEQHAPYRAWQEILRAYFALETRHSPAEQQAILQRVVVETAPEQLDRLPLLNDIFNLKLPENSFTARLDPSPRRQNLFLLVAALLRAWTREAPLLLVLEDAQWLDSLSWELVTYLTRSLLLYENRLLLVLSLRPPEEGTAAAASLAGLKNLEVVETLPVAPLADAEVAAVAAQVLGLPGGEALHSGLPSELAEMVCRRAEGNPFFAEELVFTLRDQGAIAIDLDPPRCRVVGDLTQAAQALPDTVQGLILARIDRLAPEHQLTLKVAAVIGRTFAYAPLHHTIRQHAGVDEESLRRSLDDLAASDLTPLQAPRPDLTYIFKHIITQDVAYQTLLFSQRRQLHQTAAEWYEAHYPEQLDELAALLAFHYLRAGDDRQALAYLLQAGERSRRLYAQQEAIAHFQNALLCAGRLDAAATAAQRQAIHLALGVLFTDTGQYEAALPHLDLALSLARERGDGDVQAAACRWRARWHELRSEYPAALEWVQTGLAALGERQTAESAELLAVAGLTNTRLGNYAAAREACLAGQAIAGPRPEARAALARICNVLGGIYSMEGHNSRAAEYYQQALDLYAANGDLYGQAVSHNQVANACFFLSRWQEAGDHYRQSRDFFGQVGHIFNHAVVDNNLGGIFNGQGRLDEALACYHAGLQAFERIGGSAYWTGLIHMNLAETFTRRGEIEPACRHLQLSQIDFERAQARDLLPLLKLRFAETALLDGRREEAQAYGEQALALARELQARVEEGSIQRVLGEIAIAGGRFAAAAACLAESLRIQDEVANEFEKARSQMALAHLHLAQGEVQPAKEQLEQCRPVFERLDARLELAEVQKLAKE